MADRDAGKYLKDTEHATRHLFAGVNQCESLLRGLTPPSEARTMDEVRRYMEAAEAYFGRSFSEATLCGSILQVAFVGVFLFSRNTAIPDDCATLVKATNQKAVRFCMGRRVHGVPVGLLIYAGRNQFNHWDDEAFDSPTTAVFGALMAAHYDNPLFDLAYEMNYPARTLKANHIVLNELRWRVYDEYEADMRSLLGSEGAL
jgi:hypothetical protein